MTLILILATGLRVSVMSGLDATDCASKIEAWRPSATDMRIGGPYYNGVRVIGATCEK